MSADRRHRACPDTSLAIGTWRVDPLANEIRRGAETVKLEPKVMQVLCVLAARPGRVVSRHAVHLPERSLERNSVKDLATSTTQV